MGEYLGEINHFEGNIDCLILRTCNPQELNFSEEMKNLSRAILKTCNPQKWNFPGEMKNVRTAL